MIWYCWAKGCGWSGPDEELGLYFYNRPMSPPGNTACCPKCYGAIHDEADTTREEAEERLKG